MTREYFRREMLAIANRHGVRAGEWRKMGDRFCILFLVLSILDSIVGSLAAHDHAFVGTTMFSFSVVSIWRASICHRRGMREEREALRYRQEALDGMWKGLRR